MGKLKFDDLVKLTEVKDECQGDLAKLLEYAKSTEMSLYIDVPDDADVYGVFEWRLEPSWPRSVSWFDKNDPNSQKVNEYQSLQSHTPRIYNGIQKLAANAKGHLLIGDKITVWSCHSGYELSRNGDVILLQSVRPGEQPKYSKNGTFFLVKDGSLGLPTAFCLLPQNLGKQELNENDFKQCIRSFDISKVSVKISDLIQFNNAKNNAHSNGTGDVLPEPCADFNFEIKDFHSVKFRCVLETANHYRKILSEKGTYPTVEELKGVFSAGEIGSCKIYGVNAETAASAIRPDAMFNRPDVKFDKSLSPHSTKLHAMYEAANKFCDRESKDFCDPFDTDKVTKFIQDKLKKLPAKSNSKDPHKTFSLRAARILNPGIGWREK